MPSQYIDIIFFAMIAAFIGFRLYSVLGRRTGHERSPEEQVRVPEPRRAKAEDTVVALPDRGGVAAGGPLARAMMDIKLADRTFDEHRFIDGARQAYEMIVTAFATGDRQTLHDLVSDDVFRTFDSAIKAREQRKEHVEFEFKSVKAARITGAELKDRMAEVTVTFEGETVLAGYDPDGKLIEGEAKTPQTVTDIWTFARDTTSRDPNWQLVATANG